MNPDPTLTMEPEDLRVAWRALERRVERQGELIVAEITRRAVRRSLWPLVLGQTVQLLFGVATTLVGVWLWRTFQAVPLAFVCGIVVHVYGVAVIIASGVVLGGIQRLDPTLPVVALQERLAKLRRAYVVGGAVVGLPWWVLWTVPPIVVAALRAEADPSLGFPRWLALSLAFGVLGLAATWWWHRWVRRPGREALAARLAASGVGAALRRAQADLDAARAYEAE
jgi:hypothetical protein